MFIIYGSYRLKQKRIAYRHDYWLKCAAEGTSQQIRTIELVHMFYITFFPLGLRKYWTCTTCGLPPDIGNPAPRILKKLVAAVLRLCVAVVWLVPAPEWGTFLWPAARVFGPLIL